MMTMESNWIDIDSIFQQECLCSVFNTTSNFTTSFQISIDFEVKG
jgi:hypothetical protein